MWFHFTAVTLYYFLPHKYLFNLFCAKAKTGFHNSAICQITLKVHTCILTGCSLAHFVFFVIPRQSVSQLWIIKTCCHFSAPNTLKHLLPPLNLHELSLLWLCNLIMACNDLIVVDKCPFISNVVSVSISQVKFYYAPDGFYLTASINIIYYPLFTAFS